MAEMTLSLKVDLVLSDMALELLANSVRHNLFNRCCHFAYGDAAMWPKCVRHAQNAIFTQNFAMSATPVICFLSVGGDCLMIIVLDLASLSLTLHPDITIPVDCA